MTALQTELPLIVFQTPAAIADLESALDSENTSLHEAIKAAQKRLIEIRREQGAATLAKEKAFLIQFKERNTTPIADLLKEEDRRTYKPLRQLNKLPGIAAPGSYWAATGQSVLQLQLHRHRAGEVEATAECLTLFLEHLTPFEGVRQLSVSASGSSDHRACFSTDLSSCYVKHKRQRHDDSSIRRFSTVTDLLSYVQEELYYSDDKVPSDY